MHFREAEHGTEIVGCEIIVTSCSLQVDVSTFPVIVLVCFLKRKLLSCGALMS